jgi:hypothetical protein
MRRGSACTLAMCLCSQERCQAFELRGDGGKQVIEGHNADEGTIAIHYRCPSLKTYDALRLSLPTACPWG